MSYATEIKLEKRNKTHEKRSMLHLPAKKEFLIYKFNHRTRAPLYLFRQWVLQTVVNPSKISKSRPIDTA